MIRGKEGRIVFGAVDCWNLILFCFTNYLNLVILTFLEDDIRYYLH